ncbi:hypothetical protein MTO96_008287 [Rhipicephalus appendiculatus]
MASRVVPLFRAYKLLKLFGWRDQLPAGLDDMQLVTSSGHQVWRVGGFVPARNASHVPCKVCNFWVVCAWKSARRLVFITRVSDSVTVYRSLVRVGLASRKAPAVVAAAVVAAVVVSSAVNE